MQTRSLALWSLAIGGALLSNTMLAEQRLADEGLADQRKARVSVAIQQVLEASYPDVKVIDVKPAPVAGLYEVFTGDAILYADPSGEHLLVGSLLETKTRRDLTQERLDARNAIDFDSLPFDRAIKVVKGDGRRKLAVFSDPDCPYCQRLENELANLTDATIYTFLFPIAELHPDAVPKSRAIWCAPDRDKVWVEWMTERKPPPLKPPCKGDPIDELQALGQKLRVSSTPTLYFADGRRVIGAKSAAEIDTLLDATLNVPAGARPSRESR